MTEQRALINGAIYIRLGNLVVFFDGARVECGLLEGGANTVHIAQHRERLRQMDLRHKREKRARKRAKRYGQIAKA